MRRDRPGPPHLAPRERAAEREDRKEAGRRDGAHLRLDRLGVDSTGCRAVADGTGARDRHIAAELLERADRRGVGVYTTHQYRADEVPFRLNEAAASVLFGSTPAVKPATRAHAKVCLVRAYMRAAPRPARAVPAVSPAPWI